MLKALKNSILKLFAALVYPYYKKQILIMLDKHKQEQIRMIQDIIEEAIETGQDIYVEQNPMLLAPMAIYTGFTDQGDEGKENPFKLVEDEEE